MYNVMEVGEEEVQVTLSIRGGSKEAEEGGGRRPEGRGATEGQKGAGGTPGTGGGGQPGTGRWAVHDGQQEG